MLEPAEHYTHKQLRCCLAFLLFAVFSYNSFAVNACVENDTVSVVLDSQIMAYSEGSYTYNTNKTFDVSMPYGHIRGIAACLSTNHGLQYKDIYTENNGILTDEGAIIKGGENNGSYCWCKITYPVISGWINHVGPSYYNEISYQTCATTCGGNCGWNIANDYEFRKALFNSIHN